MSPPASIPASAPARSNRAAAPPRLGRAAAALADADAAARLRPEWPKAHFRRGCALEVQGQLDKVGRAATRGSRLLPRAGGRRGRPNP